MSKQTVVTKPIIVVDIDDVLAAEAEFIINYSNKHWGHSLSLDDYHEHWSELWGVDAVETERRAIELHAPGIVQQYRLLERGHEVLGALAERYELAVLTSRRKTVQEETMEWLQENFGDIFGEVRFTGFYDQLKIGRHLLTKADILVEMHADYLIDDQPKHCFSAAEKGITALLFGDYGVSRELNIPAGVVRCTDWTAVQEYFDGIGA